MNLIGIEFSHKGRGFKITGQGVDDKYIVEPWCGGRPRKISKAEEASARAEAAAMKDGAKSSNVPGS